MPADVRVMRLTGPLESIVETDITGIATRASLSDDPNPGSNYPVTNLSTVYTYWVNTQLKALTPPDGTISNIKWYTDGAGTVGMRCGRAADYSQAVAGGVSSGSLLSTSSYSGLSSLATNGYIRTVSSPLSITGTLSNPDTGLFGMIVVYQFQSNTGVTTGIHTETFTWAWDET